MTEKTISPDDRLQQEFNRWADDGRRREDGAPSPRHHRENDAAHGSASWPAHSRSWLRIRLGDALAGARGGEGSQAAGQVVGVDISDEMIRQARAASKDFTTWNFVEGSAAQIPCEENLFDKVLSVESFYYYPDQDALWPNCFASWRHRDGFSF